MGVVFDTSILISLERAKSSLDQFVTGREAEPFGNQRGKWSRNSSMVSIRVNSEGRRVGRESCVERIIELFPVYLFDLAAQDGSTPGWANLAQKRQPTGAHDLSIAGTAISFGFSVLTFNPRGFERIEGLTAERLSEQN
jgi:predicted nucleic acid-binding protein